MYFNFPVLSEQRAEIKRGCNAEAMLHCPRCEKDQGVFLGKMRRMSIKGENTKCKKFQEIVWERWQCLFCRNVWTERYGLKESLNGHSS